MVEQFRQDRRDDLPRDAVPVLQPAARPRFAAALGEPGPVLVDLLLRSAVHLERDGLGELVFRPAVQRGELLAVQLEAHRHHRARRPRAGLAVIRDVGDPRVPEDRRVEPGRLLALGVEPQPRGDLLHGRRPFALSS